jgi:hypothetical protein
LNFGEAPCRKKKKEKEKKKVKGEKDVEARPFLSVGGGKTRKKPLSEPEKAPIRKVIES